MPEKFIAGKTINLRDIEIADAQFILDLRCNEKKSRFIFKIEPDLQKQIDYLQAYKNQNSTWYFIIEDKNAEPLGAVRIYDIQGDSFCWGSWVIKDDVPASTAIESALLVYEYAFYTLGFKRSHFDVRKGNAKVQAFHERFGAIRTGETELDFLYGYDLETYEKIKPRYARWLP